MSVMVILIDDDQDDLDLLTEAIKEHDKTIVQISFRNPEYAIKAITKELIILPDYVFIDINMPVLTGDKILRRLRSRPEFNQVTIIMFSTAMSSTNAETYRRDGANFTFQKPNSFDSYSQILKTIFGEGEKTGP